MIKFDLRQLEHLRNGIAKYQNAIPKSLAKSSLRKAAAPMLDKARRFVPIGMNGAERVSLRHKGRNEYRQGGATRRDLRIKVVPEKGTEIARVVVGVSAKKGKVGWRTHFITRGFTDRAGGKHPGKDFLEQAHNASIDMVQDTFYKEMFSGFIKWGKLNLPQ